MPSTSAVLTFNDPDTYAASSRAVKAALTITGRGRFHARHSRIELRQLRIQRFSDNLPRIAHWANIPGEAVISFRTGPGAGLVASGLKMDQSTIIRRSDAQEYFQQSDGPARFGSMSLPIGEMAAAGAAITGCDLRPPNDAQTIAPLPAAMAKLQYLHAAAGRLARDIPLVLAHPEVARGLEQALIGAMVRCLSTVGVQEDRAALRQHAAIMRRFHEATEEHLDRALYIPELCAAIGASERTLRICCREHLGMSPKRYLLMRRMHMARRALRRSAPTETTVTEIATRYGFWQFGRFAGEYKALFGEPPSAMLARPVEP